ncbi:hypothetical protein DKK68_06475 [Bifidobacterium asteroides]|nr:hypothetical protein DKK68_06475 [Bifidobacterium asteroides]
MTGNTTARTQAVELGEHLREVAAWNVRLHLAKEELEQQALCEAAGVTKATISARMNLDAAWDLNAIAAAAVTLGMPPAELLDDTLYDIVNNDDTNTNEGKGASLVAALTSTLLARHIAGRCDPLKTKGSCRITMMATGANRYPRRESNSRCQIESLTAVSSKPYSSLIMILQVCTDSVLSEPRKSPASAGLEDRSLIDKHVSHVAGLPAAFLSH